VKPRISSAGGRFKIHNNNSYSPPPRRMSSSHQWADMNKLRSNQEDEWREKRKMEEVLEAEAALERDRKNKKKAKKEAKKLGSQKSS
tara:strand:- start:282 stop:542 length:261 start_codon:yes stop_codon:yes gene_type:complete